MEAIDEAINIDDQDDALYQMKGVILRNKMRTTR